MLAFVVFLAACTDDEKKDPQQPDLSTIPGVPDEPSVIAINSTAIDISWNMVSNATYYEIWQNGIRIGRDITSLAARDIELIPNTLYSYSIKACNASGCSALSLVASAITLAIDSVIPTDPVIPSIPGGFTVVVLSSTSLSISWTGLRAATYYEVRNSEGSKELIANISAPTTNYIATGLSSGTQYIYRIKACNDIGCSVASESDSAFTFPEAPGVPRITVLGPRSLNVSWNVVTGEDIYKIVQVLPAPREFDDINDGSTWKSFKGSLLPDTTYSYTIMACNAGGCSVPSVATVATTDAEAPSNRPLPIMVSPFTLSSLNISWGSVDNAAYYEIFNGTKEPSQPQILIANISAPLTSHIATGLQSLTEYTYFVRACNRAGCSGYAKNSATTVTDTFAAPVIQAVRVNPPFALNISWQPQAAAYYQVISDRFPVIRVDAPTNYTVVTGLLPGTTYYYTIRSCASDNSCISSAEGSGITYSLSHVTVKLAWVDQLETPAFNGYMGILDDDTSVIPPILVAPGSVYINSLASRLSLVGVSFDTTRPVSEFNLNATNFLESKFSLADANLFNSGWDEDHRFARHLSKVAGGVFFANTNSSRIDTTVISRQNRMDLNNTGVERYLRLAALGDDDYNAGAQNAILRYASTLPLRTRYNSTVQRVNKNKINAIDDLIAVNISGVTEDVTVVARMCALPNFGRDNSDITCAEPALPAAMDLSNILLLDGYWKTPVNVEGDTDTNCLGGAFNSTSHFCDIQGRSQPALNPATNMPFGSTTNVTAVEENRVIPLYIRQYINRRAYFNFNTIDATFSDLTKLADDDSLNEDAYYLITIQALNSKGTRVSNQLKMIFETRVE